MIWSIKYLRGIGQFPHRIVRRFPQFTYHPALTQSRYAHVQYNACGIQHTHKRGIPALGQEVEAS